MNPTSCKSCFRGANQVKLQGNGLKIKTPLQVYNMLQEKTQLIYFMLQNMTRRGSVAFLHFSNHAMTSVFYNPYDSTGLNIDGFVCTVKATNKNGIVTTYSQVDIARFLPTSRPPTIIQPPESSSQPPEPRVPQPTITARWKRVFEEGLQLLEDEYVTKKARLNELDNRIKEIMEERQSILVEIED